MLLCMSVKAQKLTQIGEMKFKKYLSASESVKYVNEDDNDVFCAAIDILIPNVTFKVSGPAVKKSEKIINGYRVHVIVPVKSRNVVIDAEGYSQIVFPITSNDVHNLYLYQMVFQGKEELSQAFKDTVFVEKIVEKEVVKYVEKEVVVEKEKLVEVDASKDKTYLILNIDQPNATVSVDGKRYPVKGKEFNESIKNGKHKIVVSKENYINTEFELNLKGGAKALDVSLHHVTGSLTVTVKNAPNLEMKLGNQNIYSGVTTKNLVGQYKLTMIDGRRQKTKSITIDKGEDLVMRYRFSRRQRGYGFIGASYSPDAYAGLQFGGGRRMGWIADFQISPVTLVSTFNKMAAEDKNTVDAKTYYRKDIQEMPSDLSAEELMAYTEEGSYRISGHFGLSWRWCRWFGIYASAGYGNHTTVYTYDDKPFRTEMAKGAEAMGGAFFKIGWLMLNASYVKNFGPVDFSTYNAGFAISW